MNIVLSTERIMLTPTAYLLLRRDDEVLLMRRANTGYMDGRYCLVAGHLEKDEPAAAAMVREAKEEIGIILNPEDLQLVHVGHRFNRGRIDFIFAATSWQGEIQNMEPDKCDDLSWHPAAALPGNAIPYVRHLLDSIAKGVMYSEYFEEL